MEINAKIYLKDAKPRDFILSQLTATNADIEETYDQDGYQVFDIVSANGEEDVLLALARQVDAQFPDSDLRIWGQGEEYYVFLIRKDPDSGEMELRRWEEDDPEELMEYQDWFNDGLPESLHVQVF